MILFMDSQFASDLNHITLQMESFYQFTNLKIKHIQRNVELSDAYDIRVSSLLNLCSRLVEKNVLKVQLQHRPPVRLKASLPICEGSYWTQCW